MNNTYKRYLQKRLIFDMICFSIQIRYMTFPYRPGYTVSKGNNQADMEKVIL